MGPPSMNGGRYRAQTYCHAHRSCFNGAAVDERRKAEFDAALALSEIRASMGPPSMNGGRLAPTW